MQKKDIFFLGRTFVKLCFVLSFVFKITSE